MRIQQSIASLLLAAVAAAGFAAAPAQATHETGSVGLGVEVTGGAANVLAKRTGWSAHIVLNVIDLNFNDGRCVVAVVKLIVPDGPDPRKTITACGGAPAGFVGRLAPGTFGLGIPSVRLTLCIVETFACDSDTRTLPQLKGHGTVFQKLDMFALMEMQLSSFLEHKADKDPDYLDWSDDGCSTPEWLPFGDVFRKVFRRACIRHDFGYRNYGQDMGLQPTDSRRAYVDGRFEADLLKICKDRYWWFDPRRGVCNAAARAGYSGVKLQGGEAFFKD